MINYLEKIESLGIEYKNAGENRIHILCPYHSETKPSLLVFLDNGMWKCYGCSKFGPFYVLWAELSGISIKEAKKQILELETPEAKIIISSLFLYCLNALAIIPLPIIITLKI